MVTVVLLTKAIICQNVNLIAFHTLISTQLINKYKGKITCLNIQTHPSTNHYSRRTINSPNFLKTQRRNTPTAIIITHKGSIIAFLLQIPNRITLSPSHCNPFSRRRISPIIHLNTICKYYAHLFIR